MAARCRSVLTHADERQLADVKACGPGAPTLALSRRRCLRIALMTVAIKPGHRGERAINVKTVAQGMPVDRQHLWYLPPAFFSQAGHG